LGGTGRAEIAPSESSSHTFGQAGAFDYNCGTTGSPPETAQLLVVDKSSGSGVRERPLLFLEGPFELLKGFGIDGWMVFEVPEGTEFRDMRWRAGDSITVSFALQPRTPTRTPTPTIAPPASSEGVFGSKWGTEGTGDGQFDNPAGVAVASDGSVYVADSLNDRIQKFSLGP